MTLAHTRRQDQNPRHKTRAGAWRVSLPLETKRIGEREGNEPRAPPHLCGRCLTPTRNDSSELGGINRSLTLASRHGSENDIPPRRTDTKTPLIVLEMMAHVQLAQPTPDLAFRAGVMQSEMHRVIHHVTGKETATHTPAKRQPKRHHEQPKKQPGQQDREGGRQNETPRIVRMIVMHTVNHPMNIKQPTPASGASRKSRNSRCADVQVRLV